jgi:hypothetical protein
MRLTENQLVAQSSSGDVIANIDLSTFRGMDSREVSGLLRKRKETTLVFDQGQTLKVTPRSDLAISFDEVLRFLIRSVWADQRDKENAVLSQQNLSLASQVRELTEDRSRLASSLEDNRRQLDSARQERNEILGKRDDQIRELKAQLELLSVDLELEKTKKEKIIERLRKIEVTRFESSLEEQQETISSLLELTPRDLRTEWRS